MAQSVAYAIALFLSVGVVFLATFVALSFAFAYAHDFFFPEKDENDDYGPVIGDQMEFFPKSFGGILFLSMAIAAVPPIPITLWAFNSVGWTAPWLSPPSTDEYWQEIAAAEVQYKQAMAQYDLLTGQSREELQKAREELTDAEQALAKTRKLIQEEFGTVQMPQSEPYWPWWCPLVITYVAGVIQSAIGSAVYEKIKHRKKKSAAVS